MNGGKTPWEACLRLYKPLVLDRTPSEVRPWRITLGQRAVAKRYQRWMPALFCNDRENSSGQKRRLGRISKRGDVYLRTLLIHGARTVLVAAKRLKHPDRLRAWALRVQQHRGMNKATVALANKMARIVWAVWRDGSEYKSQAVV